MRTAVIIGQNYPDAELVEIVGMHDRTIVFEPLPEAAEACRNAFANDPRLIVFQAACGESFSISKLNIYNHHGLSSSLGELTAEAREIYTTQDLSHKGSISVQVVNAAYILQMAGVQFIDFLLIDAQGMDFTILQTLQSYLEATAIGFIQIEADGAGFVHYTDTPDNSEESILAYMRRFPAYLASRQPGRMAEQPDLLFAICGK
jgi:FkbM family methyltransferase